MKARCGNQRYYDHNVRTYESFVEKLRHIHRNPMKRGLVEKPEDWKWSSFRHYAMAEFGPVEIESQWTADRRIGRKATTSAKTGQIWGTIGPARGEPPARSTM